MIIGDLSETLKRLVQDTGFKFKVRDASGEIVEIKDFIPVSFDPPSSLKDKNDTLINLYLYDIQENTALENGDTAVPTIVRDEETGVFERRPPYIATACSYLVTVWPKNMTGVTDTNIAEHWLLGQVLQLFAQYPTIPEELLYGTLSVKGNPDMKHLPLPGIQLLKDFSAGSSFELWSSLQIGIKLSFTLTVKVSLPVSYYGPADPIYTVETIDSSYDVNGSLEQIITGEKA